MLDVLLATENRDSQKEPLHRRRANPFTPRESGTVAAADRKSPPKLRSPKAAAVSITCPLGTYAEESERESKTGGDWGR